MIIAFCFLLSYTFPMEYFWERFFKNATNFLIIIHAKPSLELKTSFFLTRAIILDPIETSWGNINLVKAQNLMLEHACIKMNADFCCLLSGNCIAVKTFDFIKKNLNEIPLSRFFLSTSYYFLFSKKQSQWCVLSLEHVQIILKYSSNYFDFFERNNFNDISTTFGAPDEYFYINLLLSHNITNFLENGSTYCKWENLHLGHPKSFTNITRNKIMKLEKSHYFFMRKITPKCIITDEINNHDTNIVETYYPTRLPVYLEMKRL